MRGKQASILLIALHNCTITVDYQALQFLASKFYACKMDRFEFPSADNVQAESSQGSSRGTGLRLVIPSLKTIQALKGKQKGNNGSAVDTTPVQKIPRPAKLKPLKEVLTKLIAQIKK